MDAITIAVLVKMMFDVMSPDQPMWQKNCQAWESTMRHFIVSIANIRYRFINFQRVTVQVPFRQLEHTSMQKLLYIYIQINGNETEGGTSVNL